MNNKKGYKIVGDIPEILWEFNIFVALGTWSLDR